MKSFHKVLVANRGEIACRVIRSARQAGYATVAVYSEADAGAPHVALADEAVCIGPAPVGESYLAADKIIWACRVSGADALHPGYGFLSENAAFAKACVDADVVFIGPPADSIELMGSKRHSKIAMEKAGVPFIPGYQGDAQDLETLESEAARIGVPLMIKASAGGGGRGMRLVTDLTQMEEEIARARSEAEKAFGDGELILERAVLEPRHIEIQVFGDTHGNCVYLGERDCSIQRRHQKVIEEAPSVFLDETLRAQMGEAAVRAARSCDYVGAGTVEFLVDAERRFYFLEMNTRLQVEHPVTELITGVDLVDWQLRIAAGEALPLKQDEIMYSGHAIEVRLYAEDPSAGFMPQTGTIRSWEYPSGEGLRVDSGIESGNTVSPHYDPMLAKLIAWGRDRNEALRRVRRLVTGTHLLGVVNNKDFLLAALEEGVFERGEATTAFVERCLPEEKRCALSTPSLELELLAAGLLHLQDSLGRDGGAPSVWSNTAGSGATLKLSMRGEEKVVALDVERFGGGIEFSFRGDESETKVRIDELSESRCRYTTGHVTRTAAYSYAGGTLFLDTGRCSLTAEDTSRNPACVEDGSGSGHLTANTDGAVVALEVSAGESVEKGQTLVVIEAMKMEHPIRADVDGTVSEVLVEQGAQVKMRQHLISIAPMTE